MSCPDPSGTGTDSERRPEAVTVTGGTYTLAIRVPERATIEVGALGELTFDPGWYAYAGSAFGPGGFARIDRHRELATGERTTRHWHVDYLLGHGTASLAGVARSPGVDRECEVARSLPGTGVPGFGASDCDCDSHLVRAPGRAELFGALERIHEDVVRRERSGP